MSSFKSQPDVRASDCSGSGLASSVTHSREMAGAAVSGQASRPVPSQSFTVTSAGMQEGGEKDGPSALSGSHTNCFQPRGDREDRTVQTNGPKDGLILFRANLLSHSWQACSKYASSRAPQHAGDSSRFPQDAER